MKCLQSLIFVAFIFTLLIGFSALSEEIHLPDSTPLSGTVLIAESFYEQVKGEDDPVPLQFEAWPRKMKPSDWFNVCIEAHPGDVIVLSPGQYKADLWVFAPGITITTEPDAEEMAEIWGTVEIDADGIILDRITVTGPRKNSSSGHGIEVNRGAVDRITIRNCRSADNEWTGIHIIGAHGTIAELRVENCELKRNGMDGMDARYVVNLIITGCTITDNGWDFADGVGVRIERYVEHVEMHDNVISGNRSADVYQKGQ